MRFNRAHDLFGDFVLKGKNVRQFTIEPISPQVGSSLGVYELS
jgi:hypothetical protein